MRAPPVKRLQPFGLCEHCPTPPSRPAIGTLLLADNSPHSRACKRCAERLLAAAKR